MRQNTLRLWVGLQLEEKLFAEERGTEKDE